MMMFPLGLLWNHTPWLTLANLPAGSIFFEKIYGVPPSKWMKFSDQPTNHSPPYFPQPKFATIQPGDAAETHDGHDWNCLGDGMLLGSQLCIGPNNEQPLFKNHLPKKGSSMMFNVVTQPWIPPPSQGLPWGAWFPRARRSSARWCTKWPSTPASSCWRSGRPKLSRSRFG